MNMMKYMKSSATWPVSLDANDLYRPYIPKEIYQFTFSVEELDEMSKYAQSVPFVEENATKFIVGKRSFSEWDKYVSEIKNMNVEGIENIYRQAYERWKKVN